jgi:hypothetical protein
MRLWISGEVMADVGEQFRKAFNQLEKNINTAIKTYTFGIYEEWAVIAIILNSNELNYQEVFRKHKKKKVIELRLKIDHDLFLNSSFNKQISLLADMLLRSLDEISLKCSFEISKDEIEVVKKVVSKYI